MSEVLLIRLGSSSSELIPWVVWSDAEQDVIAAGELNGAKELVKLSEHGDGREVRVLLPACDVTLKTVVLPGKFNRQLQAALPFMLEEDLTQDIDKLFFAIGEKGLQEGKHTIDIAVVDKSLMSTWRDWLEQAQLKAVQFVPDALCLPLNDNGASGIELAGQWLVRGGNWQCAAVDDSWFEQYLQLAGLHHKDETDEPYSFVAYSPFTAEVENVQVEDGTPELPLKLLAGNLKATSFNLLQGEFAFKKEGSKVWRTWRTAAMVAGIAVVMQLGYRGGMAWYLSGQVEQEKAAFTELYKQAFPGSRMRPNLMERDLRRKMKALNGSDGGDVGFLAMLEQVAPLFSQSGSFVPSSFRYDAKRSELRMEASANGFQDFEKFKTVAQQQGFSVTQGSLSNDGDKVLGSVSVRKGG